MKRQPAAPKRDRAEKTAKKEIFIVALLYPELPEI
jgi:hypothetical protein